MPAGSVPNDESLSLDERIRRRAYELYEERGCQQGFELDDWLKAQEEVLAAQQLPPPDIEP